MDFYGFLWIFPWFSHGFSHGFPMVLHLHGASGMVGFWPETQRGFLRIGTAELHGVGGAQASCFEVEKYGGFHQWLLIMVKNGLIIVANSI
mgnify:CR=1 FL=1